VTEAAVEVVSALADTCSSSRITPGETLDKRVGTDGTSATRSVRCTRRVRQIWKQVSIHGVQKCGRISSSDRRKAVLKTTDIQGGAANWGYWLTQPPTLCGTGNEYRSKFDDALHLGSKDRMAHSICG